MPAGLEESPGSSRETEQQMFTSLLDDPHLVVVADHQKRQTGHEQCQRHKGKADNTQSLHAGGGDGTEQHVPILLRVTSMFLAHKVELQEEVSFPHVISAHILMRVGVRTRAASSASHGS